jgi:hypothetical protein
VRRTNSDPFYSNNTAAVFEMTLPSSPNTKFVACPLVPDPDHKTVREVFGERIAGVDSRQVPRTGFQVSDLNETTGAITRMRYQAVGADIVFGVIGVGAAFNVEPAVGYEVVMGIGPSANYTVRFTGYVADVPVMGDLTKAGAQSVRWLGYSLPRDTTLNALGLQTYATPWSALNRVRLLFPGATAWTNYKYNTVGLYWYRETVPGVPEDPAIQAGLMGVVFVRGGPSDPSDKLPETPWYFSPPNEW